MSYLLQTSISRAAREAAAFQATVARWIFFNSELSVPRALSPQLHIPHCPTNASCPCSHSVVFRSKNSRFHSSKIDSTEEAKSVLPSEGLFFYLSQRPIFPTRRTVRWIRLMQMSRRWIPKAKRFYPVTETMSDSK